MPSLPERQIPFQVDPVPGFWTMKRLRSLQSLVSTPSFLSPELISAPSLSACSVSSLYSPLSSSLLHPHTRAHAAVGGRYSLSNSINPWFGYILSKERDSPLLMNMCTLVLVNNMGPMLLSLQHISVFWMSNRLTLQNTRRAERKKKALCICTIYKSLNFCIC